MSSDVARGICRWICVCVCASQADGGAAGNAACDFGHRRVQMNATSQECGPGQRHGHADTRLGSGAVARGRAPRAPPVRQACRAVRPPPPGGQAGARAGRHSRRRQRRLHPRHLPWTGRAAAARAYRKSSICSCIPCAYVNTKATQAHSHQHGQAQTHRGAAIAKERPDCHIPSPPSPKPTWRKPPAPPPPPLPGQTPPPAPPPHRPLQRPPQFLAAAAAAAVPPQLWPTISCGGRAAPQAARAAARRRRPRPCPPPSPKPPPLPGDPGSAAASPRPPCRAPPPDPARQHGVQLRVRPGPRTGNRRVPFPACRYNATPPMSAHR